MSYVALPLKLPEHREELLKLWTESMSDPHVARVAPERFRWYYEENPQGTPSTMLVVEEESQAIVGCGSFFPRQVLIRGTLHRAGILSDFIVSPSHRSAGPAVTLQRALVERSRAEGVSFLMTYPNKAAEPIFKRIGYKPVATTRRWSKPLQSARQIQKHLGSQPLARVLSPVVDAGLAATDFMKSLSFRDVTRRLETSAVRAVDARYDELWERGKGHHVLTGERSSAYLNWRYARFRSFDYTFFQAVDRVTKLVAAYLVYSIQDGGAIIADLFGQDMGSALDVLLMQFGEFARRAGTRSITADYVGPPAFGARLKTIGFFERPNDRNLFAYIDPAADNSLRETVLDESNWLMFDAELDV
jgi:predicted N-acetyltransferase YhbS